MVRHFDDLDQLIIPGTARNAQTGSFNRFQQHVVDFVAVTMTLGDGRLAVKLAYQRIITQLALLRAQAHGAAQIALLRADFNVAIFVTPFGNQGHDRVFTVWHKFRRVGVFHTRYVTRELNQRNLHTQADAQIRNIVFTRIARGGDLAFNAAVAEAARDQDSV